MPPGSCSPKKKYRDAEPFIRRAALLAPKETGYADRLALVLYMTGRYGEANKVLADALKVEPQSASLHANHAAVLLALKQRDAATTEAQEARRLGTEKLTRFIPRWVCPRLRR